MNLISIDTFFTIVVSDDHSTDSGCVTIDQHEEDVVLVHGQQWSHFKVCASKYSGVVQLSNADLSEISFSDIKGSHSFAKSDVSIISKLFIGDGVSISLFSGKNFDGDKKDFDGPQIVNLRHFTYKSGEIVNNNVYSLSVSSSTEKTGNC